MRQTTAIFLTLIVASQAFYNLVVTTYWLANRDYIAAELCVKRDEPGNCCKGKCYLNDKLANAPDQNGATDQKAPATPSIKKAVEFLAPLPEQPAICHLDGTDVVTTPRIPVGQSIYSTALPVRIFHPPSRLTA